MTTTNEKCPVCEQGTLVERKSVPVGPFRHVSRLTAAHEVAIPTCDFCGEQFTDRRVAAETDKAFEAALIERRERIVEESLTRMTDFAPQRTWERRLGLSPGYLSRIKSGKETSVPLVTLLGIVGQAPDRWAERIDDLWESEGATRNALVLRPQQWRESTQEMEILPATACDVQVPAKPSLVNIEQRVLVPEKAA